MDKLPPASASVPAQPSAQLPAQAPAQLPAQFLYPTPPVHHPRGTPNIPKASIEDMADIVAKLDQLNRTEDFANRTGSHVAANNARLLEEELARTIGKVKRAAKDKD